MLQQKLVLARRGGYCYEQNQLFKAALITLGFQVTGLAARVRWNILPNICTPRSHMLLLVETGSEKYICDVGFGGLTLTAPLKLEPDLIQYTPHESFRIVKHTEFLSLEVLIKEDWKQVYVFNLEEETAADYEVANWYVATHPESIFTNNLVVAQPTSTGRISLNNTELTERNSNGETQKKILTSVTEILTVLKNIFGIELPVDFDLGSKLSFNA
jgi:N-hydroxyarylamine O-acetyltransferase